jgi:hypothetical protein
MTHSIEIHIGEMSTLEAVAWIEAITEKFGAEFVCEWAEDSEDSEQYDEAHLDWADAMRRDAEDDLDENGPFGMAPPKGEGAEYVSPKHTTATEKLIDLAERQRSLLAEAYMGNLGVRP